MNTGRVCMCCCGCFCSRGVCAGRVRALGWAKSAPISLGSAHAVVSMDGFCRCCCFWSRLHSYKARAACPFVLASCRTSASRATSKFSASIRWWVSWVLCSTLALIIVMALLQSCWSLLLRCSVSHSSRHRSAVNVRTVSSHFANDDAHAICLSVTYASAAMLAALASSCSRAAGVLWTALAQSVLSGAEKFYYVSLGFKFQRVTDCPSESQQFESGPVGAKSDQ